MANNIEKLLACLITPCQALEDALQQLKLERFIDTADGDQLDVIGKIVGQLRLGLDDDTYRRYIRARAATLNSDGTVEDVLTVAYLIIYDDDATLEVNFQEHATVVLRIPDIAVADDLAEVLIKFLGDTVSAGVRIITETCAEDPGDWFIWDTVGRGWDNGKLIDAKDNI